MWSRFLLAATSVAGIVAVVSTVAKSEESSHSSSGLALSHQSAHGTECMTLAAARSLHRTSHLYWHGVHHCWDAIPRTDHVAHAGPSRREHVARSSPATPQPDDWPAGTHQPIAMMETRQQPVAMMDAQQPIAMMTDYLAFDMVIDEWRHMSRGLVTPLVDKALSEFDQRWPE